MTAAMWGWAILAATAWTAGYAVACAVWPYGNCLRCGGAGRKGSPTKKYFRPCRKCKGTGTRVRTGRRLWTWLSGTAHKAAG